ncbi:MAG: GFA family protein [SAR324 cluster bacterium]|nr:GFA family protein [SAR324 cluster bacterium]
MKITGGCHCGNISYEAEIDPEKIIVCHCTDCQTLSGSAFRTVAVTRSGTFRLLSGELKIYLKTGSSGAKRQQSFCPDCGTSIFAASTDAAPKIHNLRIGSIHQRDRLVPKRQIWTRSELSWVADLGSLPKVEKG